MKHVKLFEEFVLENKEEYKDSPFLKIPELCTKKRSGTRMPGDLSSVGEMVHFIYMNPGLTEREIWNIKLGHPLNTPQKDTYHHGGHGVSNILSKAFNTVYVKRTAKRPTRYYADPNPGLSIEELEAKYKPTVTGRHYGI